MAIYYRSATGVSSVLTSPRPMEGDERRETGKCQHMAAATSSPYTGNGMAAASGSSHMLTESKDEI
eukprot:352987-Chlamydomonas_euryale.AAC.18